MSDSSRQRLTIRVGPHFHRHIKSTCAHNGELMNSRIVEMLAREFAYKPPRPAARTKPVRAIREGVSA